MDCYLRSAGVIQFSKHVGYGTRSMTVCKRVPKPVRQLLDKYPDAEVSYDAKKREAKLVPLWDRVHGW